MYVYKKNDYAVALDISSVLIGSIEVQFISGQYFLIITYDLRGKTQILNIPFDDFDQVLLEFEVLLSKITL